MKKTLYKSILIAVLLFLLSGAFLYYMQGRVYRDMESLAVERTQSSIHDSLEEFYDSLDELADSYTGDLQGRVGTVALMLRDKDEEAVLKKACDLCKADLLFIEEADGRIVFSAQENIKGKKAEDVVSEFAAAKDKGSEDYACAELSDGRKLWLCDYSSALIEASTDSEDYLQLGDDLNAFNAGSAKIILWSILILAIAIVVIISYGEYLLRKSVTGKELIKKCLRVALLCLCVIGVMSFYTQTLECISSAIDTADNTGDVLTEIRAQHIVDTDNLDTYYEEHDKRRINLIAACVEADIEKTKSGTSHVYREAGANGLRKPLKDDQGKEIVSYSDNEFFRELLEINGLNEIFLTDKNGFTISSGTENWYYTTGEVQGLTDVLDGKIAFYNDEHDSEGYRLNAVSCGEGILILSRPWISEDRNIRMRKEFIYDAAESYMNARLVQSKDEEEAELSTNSFVFEDGEKYFRHRINAKSLNEGNYLIAYYPNDFVFRTRGVMIFWTIVISALAMFLVILWYSGRKQTAENAPKDSRVRMETVISACIFLVLILLFAYALQSITGGESISAIKYILNGDWKRGINFFSVSACFANVFGAIMLQQLISILFKIGSSDLEEYRKKRFSFASFIIGILIYLAALFLCLYNLGLNLSGIFASAGILSAVAGIACQNIIGNYFCGIKNMFDDTYRVGEWVRFNDFRGIITDMTATSLKIKDVNGNVMKVNHQDFINAVNLSRNASKITLELPVAVDEDISLIEKALKECYAGLNSELKKKIIGEPVLCGVSSTDGDGKNIVLHLYSQEEDFDEVSLKFSAEIIDRINASGIQSPTPVLKVIQ